MSSIPGTESLAPALVDPRPTSGRIGRAELGFAIVVVVGLIALLAPWLAPFDPDVGDGALRLAPPGTPHHLLGLDGQGRDLLSRLIWGARLSLVGSLVPVAIALVGGLLLGTAAAFLRGGIGSVIMRGIDLLFAFPMILFAVSLTAVLGPGLPTVIATIAVSLTPYVARVAYAAATAELGRDYLEAARLLGASKFEVLLSELLPNVLSPVLVYATTLVGPMIGFSSGLSFLGLGIQPPRADWGRMTVDGVAVFMEGAPHVVIAPGLAIIVVSLAFTWLGSGLRDRLDPHRRR